MTGSARGLADAASTPHVMFVNTREQLGADVAVHLGLARALPACGAAVTFTVNRSAVDAPAMMEQLAGIGGVTVLPLTLGAPLEHGRRWGRLASLFANLAVSPSFLSLARYIVCRRVDVLHATDRPRDAALCVALGFATRRPSIVHLHNNYGAWMSPLTRWALRRCTCVVAISEHTARSLKSAGIPQEKIATVLNAVDSDHFDRSKVTAGTVRARWQIPDAAPLVGLVGRIVPFKGHEDLLRAIASEPALGNVHVLIVGNDGGAAAPFANALRDLATELQISERVHFTGHQQDPRGVYADLDMLAVPSWEEPFGLVVLEGMAMSVPVVAYASGGIPELIRSGVDGLLVPARSIDGLAQAIRRLAEDPELRDRIGAAARRRVTEEFSPARQAQEMVTVYRGLAARQREVGANVVPGAG